MPTAGTMNATGAPISSVMVTPGRRAARPRTAISVRAPSADRVRGEKLASVTPDHVLVVEDDDGIREMLQSTLTFAGFRVSAAPSAEAALRLIDDDYPDALVLEVMMPG